MQNANCNAPIVTTQSTIPHTSAKSKATILNTLFMIRALWKLVNISQRPDHNFARGESAQFNVAPEYKGTMRRCENCHDASKSHANWLPYVDTHMKAVACETCHIPQMYAPAIQTYDWTVVTAKGGASTECRGVEGTPNEVTSLVTGYEACLTQSHKH